MVEIKKELTVLNRLGLHARPAARFVQCALAFKSNIRIQVGNNNYDGKRIMELLIANLDQGAKFVVEVEGPDAEAAIARIERLMKELEFEEG